MKINPSLHQEIKILRPALGKTLALLAISLIFVAAGVFLIDKNPFAAWTSLIFFGVCSIVFIIQLFPNASYLKLSHDGFEIKSLYKKSFTKWSDVASFSTQYISRNKMVVFNYSDEHRMNSIGKKVSRTISGVEGALPTTYGMKAQELADLMNEWKDRSVVRTARNN